MARISFARPKRRRAVTRVTVSGGLLLVVGLLAVAVWWTPLATRLRTGWRAETSISYGIVAELPVIETGSVDDAHAPAVAPNDRLLAEEAEGDSAAAAPTAHAEAVNYIVLYGDTLLALADREDTTVAKLLELNPGLDPSKIRAGQLIRVPDMLAAQGVARPQYLWPAEGPITTPYGESGSSWIGGYHMGLDIGASTGDWVWSAAAGTIAMTGTDGFGGRGYGTYALISHDAGWATLYAHLSKVYRDSGYVVREGEPIGEVGDTGFADGPHLHFEVWRYGIRQDPIQFLPLETER